MTESKKFVDGVYCPPENKRKCEALNATVGFKFSNDVFLLKSFLDAQNIEYKEEELDDSCVGKGIRIKRD